MLALIDEMGASIIYWLTAQYRDSPPALAQDATPSREMQKRFQDVAKRWQYKFDKAAPKIAKAYLDGSFKAVDSAMRMALKDVGFAVKFQMTPAMRDALNASLDENVGLIRSIPAQYLQQVEGVISRAYANGHGLDAMVKQLKLLYPKAANRAAIIARDQSNKATAVMARTRQLDLGIEDAIWLHSHGGKTPRPEHVKAGREKRRYKIAVGCPIPNEKGELEYIQPGEKINCRCVSRPVLPGLTQ
jgi:uncharacterized protein with gpF-like domain